MHTKTTKSALMTNTVYVTSVTAGWCAIVTLAVTNRTPMTLTVMLTSTTTVTLAVPMDTTIWAPPNTTQMMRTTTTTLVQVAAWVWQWPAHTITPPLEDPPHISHPAMHPYR